LKPVLLTLHALRRAHLRGATEEEVREVVTHGDREPAKWGKLLARKRFLGPTHSPFDGILYNEKMVEVIFADEPSRIVVITVKVYFSGRGGQG
jgi:hypothetical protein